MINRTGTPDKQFYNIGRGALFFAPLDANGKPLAYRHLGNVTNFGVNIETESIQHQSSRSGTRTTDLEIVTAITLNLNISLDEISHDNLALSLNGEIADSTSTVPTQNAAKIGFTDILQVGAAAKGRWVDLIDGAGRRAYDVVQADLTVKTESGGGGTPGSTLTAGVDYTLDTVMGRIFLLSTGGGHTNGKQVYATLAANATAQEIERVRGLTQSQIVGALKFVGSNPANSGKKREWQFHSVTLKPEGDVNLISDEYTELTLTGVAGRNEKFSQSSPVCDITDHADS
jgi:hypothetical protein